MGDSGGRHGDQVNMVGHQTVREQIDVPSLRVLTQPREIGATSKEDALATIASLSNVMGHVGHDGPREPRHGSMLARLAARSVIVSLSRVPNHFSLLKGTLPFRSNEGKRPLQKR